MQESTAMTPECFSFIFLQGVVHLAPAAVSHPQLTSPFPHTRCQTSPIPPAKMSSTMLTSSTRAALPPNTA